MKRLTTGLFLALFLWVGDNSQSIAQTPSSSAIRRAAFCPSVFILPLTDSITIFRRDAGKETDAIFYRASLDTATVSCIVETSAFPTLAEISFTGIAETENAEIITGFLPVFVTLLDRDSKVLNKQIKENAIVLTPQVTKIAYNGTFENVPVPLMAPEARAGFRFVVGFQLDRKQLEHNREAAHTLP